MYLTKADKEEAASKNKGNLESVSMIKNLKNGWFVSMSTDSTGKISMHGTKTIGTLKGSNDEGM
jgi:hypothetical protein